MAAWTTVVKKDSACSLAKDAPQPACIGEVSPNKDEDETPASVFVKIGRTVSPVPSGFGGRLKSDQGTCDDIWQICPKRTCKEILARMSDPMKAKAEASTNKSKGHVVFVHVFARWL